MEFLRDLSYGMYVITTNYEGEKAGCVVNTVTQITSQNPIISVSIHKDNYTHAMIHKSKQFAVSILSEETSKEVIGKFGFFSSKDTDKFAHIQHEEIEGMPVVQDHICGYILAEVLETIDSETHTIFLARVVGGEKVASKTPMTYAYYHQVIKGKAPKHAPTYVEETTVKVEEEYICGICGYVHKGPLPEDFICPICGADTRVFERKA